MKITRIERHAEDAHGIERGLRPLSSVAGEHLDAHIRASGSLRHDASDLYISVDEDGPTGDALEIIAVLPDNGPVPPMPAIIAGFTGVEGEQDVGWIQADGEDVAKIEPVWSVNDSRINGDSFQYLVSLMHYALTDPRAAHIRAEAERDVIRYRPEDAR